MSMYKLGSKWIRSNVEYTLIKTNQTTYGKTGNITGYLDNDYIGLIKTDSINHLKLNASGREINNFFNARKVADANNITESEFQALSYGHPFERKVTMKVGDKVRLFKEHQGTNGYRASYFKDVHVVESIIEPKGFYSKTLGHHIWREQSKYEVLAEENSIDTGLGIVQNGPLKAGRWYRINKGTFGGRIMQPLWVSNTGHCATFSVRAASGPGVTYQSADLTRLSYHSKEVQERITVNNPFLEAAIKTGCATTDDIEAGKLVESKAKANKPPKPLAQLVTEVSDITMGTLKTYAASYVTTENIKRIEKVKFDLKAATEANILEIEAIKMGVKQPKAFNWPALIVGVAGIVSTAIALFY